MSRPFNSSSGNSGRAVPFSGSLLFKTSIGRPRLPPDAPNEIIGSREEGRGRIPVSSMRSESSGDGDRRGGSISLPCATSVRRRGNHSVRWMGAIPVA